jgi:lambda family phage portal protein
VTILEKFRNIFSFRGEEPSLEFNVNDLGAYAGQTSYSDFDLSIYDGSKFAGGFGETQIQHIDYWTLRKRSAQLFNENHYARGLIRRLVTNEINTGLTPEASPDEAILGLEEDSLNDWTELVENRFLLWGKSPNICDWYKRSTFGALQREARMEALIEGDVLVVLRMNQITKLPQVQLVKGGAVQTPYNTDFNLKKDHNIEHGVELDKFRRHVAYWVLQDDGSFKRLPAYGEKSGRKLAWLVYGSDKRLDDVRGQPILSIVLQSLKEIDRYRDSAQRKAVVNSVLAMFIKKNSDKPGSLPMTGAAVRRDSISVSDSSASGVARKFNVAQYGPGMVIDELQEGEEPVLKGGDGTDINFQRFEEAILHSVAWANEIPPEILMLAFSNNYSASQAAINEFKIYLNKIWSDFGEQLCTPIYVEWLVSQVLIGKVKSQSLLESWRDQTKHDIFASWTSVDWYGSIKPSTDMLKQAKGSKMLVDEGWSTNARESRITTGTKFSKNIKRLKRENELKVEAIKPILQLKEDAELKENLQVAQQELLLSEINDKINSIYDALEDT